MVAVRREDTAAGHGVEELGRAGRDVVDPGPVVAVHDRDQVPGRLCHGAVAVPGRRDRHRRRRRCAGSGRRPRTRARRPSPGRGPTARCWRGGPRGRSSSRPSGHGPSAVRRGRSSRASGRRPTAPRPAPGPRRRSRPARTPRAPRPSSLLFTSNRTTSLSVADRVDALARGADDLLRPEAEVVHAALRVERGEHAVGHEVDRGRRGRQRCLPTGSSPAGGRAPPRHPERRDDGGDDGCGGRHGHGDRRRRGRPAVTPTLPAYQPLERHLVLVGARGSRPRPRAGPHGCRCRS